MQSVEFTKLNDMSSSMVESMRALRTNIQFCGDDVRTILFTSTVPDEGKSTVVLDLSAVSDKTFSAITFIGKTDASLEGTVLTLGPQTSAVLR